MLLAFAFKNILKDEFYSYEFKRKRRFLLDLTKFISLPFSRSEEKGRYLFYFNPHTVI